MTTPAFDLDAALQALGEARTSAARTHSYTPLSNNSLKQPCRQSWMSTLFTRAKLIAKMALPARPWKALQGALTSIRLVRACPLFGYRAGSLEPQVVQNHQPQLIDGLKRKMLALYDLSIAIRILALTSPTFMGCHWPMVRSTSWPTSYYLNYRPGVSAIWKPFIPLSGLMLFTIKINENDRYISEAIYTILGLNIVGKKELLGLYLSDNTGTHHRLSVLTDFYNRGVKDIVIACVDTQSISWSRLQTKKLP